MVRSNSPTADYASMAWTMQAAVPAPDRRLDRPSRPRARSRTDAGRRDAGVDSERRAR